MIDPAGGAGGGLLAICLIVVAPIAVILNFIFRRFALVTLLLGGAFTLFLLGVWVYFGVTTQRWAGFRLVWLGSLLSLAAAMIGGLPAALFRMYEHFRRRGN